MATKSKRATPRGKKSKPKGNAKAKPKTKSGMKAKATKLLARISAKVTAAKADVRGRAKAGSKVLANAGAKAKAPPAAPSARRPPRNVRSPRNSPTTSSWCSPSITRSSARRDYEGARQYMGATYRQHAPMPRTAMRASRSGCANSRKGFPQHRYEGEEGHRGGRPGGAAPARHEWAEPAWRVGGRTSSALKTARSSNTGMSFSPSRKPLTTPTQCSETASGRRNDHGMADTQPPCPLLMHHTWVTRR